MECDHKMNSQTEPALPKIVGMAANPLVAQVWRLAEPLCLSEGVELAHIEFQREHKGRTLRVYIDKPGGVTLDDCTAISRQLSDILDVSLDIPASYRLEVSSPGLQRPLGKLDDFKRYAGRRVKIRTMQAVKGQKNFTGVLKSVDDTKIRININDICITLTFEDIAKAHLVGS
ncbi:MAG: ribosome maturation factor RimP [Desulfobacteraceae bacterium]|nr:ribosome maturation factor RimP [Desulfobacteraceae bacterium]